MSDPGEDLTIVVDRDVCMGSGMCVMYAPNTFSQDEGTKVLVRDPKGDPTEEIRTAIEACPTGALRIADNQKRA